MNVVLVISCLRNGLGIIRSLGEKNNYIIGVDHYSNSPGLHSKYLNEKHIIPDPKKDELKFIEDLIAIAKKHTSKIYIIPTGNEYIYTFIKHKNILEEYYIPLFLTDMNLLDNCSEKTKYEKLLANTIVNLPRHYNVTLSSIADLSINYPVIIKPTKLNNNVNGKMVHVFKNKTCYNNSELIEAIEILNNAEIDYVVQEIIPGDDSNLYTCGISAINGQLLACFTGRKLRQFPPKTGEASFAESVVDEELIEYAKLISKITQFTGISQIEFKKYNSKYYFIEMNPRTYSWNSLATFCGVNLPNIIIEQYHSTTEVKLKTNDRYGTWIFAYEDFLHNVILNKNISLFQFLKDVFSANKHAYFLLKDPKPALYFYLIDFNNKIKHYIKNIFKSNKPIQQA